MVAVEESDRHLGNDPAAGAQPTLLRVVQRGRAEQPGLVRAVELQDLCAGELLEFGGRPVRQRLAAGEHDAQRTQVVVPAMRGRPSASSIAY